MAPRAWRPALATVLRVGVLRELECLLREPGSGRWIIKPAPGRKAAAAPRSWASRAGC